jgi:hypothetical protein
MFVGMGVMLFLVGLGISLGQLLRFEGDVRRAWVDGGSQKLDRTNVGVTLRGLIFSSLVSGMGIGLLGMSAFVGGRSGPAGAAAYLWATLFALVACLGWPAIVVMAFMARVNTLERFGRQ